MCTVCSPVTLAKLRIIGDGSRERSNFERERVRAKVTHTYVHTHMRVQPDCIESILRREFRARRARTTTSERIIISNYPRIDDQN